MVFDGREKPPVALKWDMKLWWPQYEAMIANKYAFSFTGKENYQDFKATHKLYNTRSNRRK